MTKNGVASRALDRPLAGRRVLLSTVSSDAHTWNLVYLQLFLEEAGCTVANLGPCVPDDLLVTTARRQRPDAIVISWVNGHGCRDGARVVRALRRDPLTQHIPVLIGGKLGIHGAADGTEIGSLLDAGCNAVFTVGAAMDMLVTELAAATGSSASRDGRHDWARRAR